MRILIIVILDGILVLTHEVGALENRPKSETNI
jgi:hypothetical protein